MADPGIVATIASIIAGFGVAMLFFRIDRELRMRERGEPVWIARADWLLIVATLCSLVIVLLPLLLFADSGTLGQRLPTAGCSAALVLLAGYIIGILSHYRLLFGSTRSGPRTNPEPSERRVVIGTLVASSAVFVWSLLSSA